ncbi:MAG TPA: diacylglycerol kinase family protein [Candidatus Paceibacterota bacterium]|nr:diacylglycerol kinase family protein [Candidatus Paceibacterota bacterium]
MDLKNLKVAVLLNTASGSCTEAAATEIDAILEEAGVHGARTWICSPEQIAGSFAEIAAYRPELFIVLGGDGTIRCAAERSREMRAVLVPLPGGTMNMLPKAIYGDRSWHDALRDTLAAPQVREISGGCANGVQFFIAAIVGGPTLWTHAREALRTGDLPEAIARGMHAFTNMLAKKVTYSFSPSITGEADALVALCPLISTEMSDTAQGLEAAVIEVEDALGALSLASSAAFGAWRANEKVALTSTKHVTISAAEDIPIILDGESMELGNAIDIAFIPNAFTVLAPRA